MMDLTPLEVRKKKGDFRRAMRGYEPALVDDFLDLVADRLEELVRENMALAERSARHEKEVTEFRDRERALTEALVTAQEMREEMRRQAAREAELSWKTAEQETGQLRATVEQEVAQLRAEAQMDAQAVRSSAQQDAVALRNSVTQELMQMRNAAETSLQRTQEAVRSLQARHQQSLATFRSWLERELAELNVIARTMTSVTPDAASTSAAGLAAQVAAAVEVAADMDDEPFSPELVLENVELHAVEDPATPVGLPTDGDAPATARGVESAEVPHGQRRNAPGGRKGKSSRQTLPDEEDPDEEDPDAALLRNAAAAGYRVPDDEDELLGEAGDPQDGGWLPDVLEDER